MLAVGQETHNPLFFGVFELAKEIVMLCQDGTEDDLEDPNNAFEFKHDGTSLKATRKGGKVRLENRHGLAYTVRLPQIRSALMAVNDEDFIVHGEAVYVNPDMGKEEFVGSQIRCSTHFPDYTLIQELPLKYAVWDIMRLNGKQLEKLPFLQRKTILQETLEDCGDDRVEYVPYRYDGVKFFKEVKKAEGEGLIAKDVNSAYVYERSYSWVKIKNWRHEICDVVGYTEGKNSRRHFFGALVLAWNGQRRGKAGSGFNDWELAQIKDILHKAKKIDWPFEIDEPYTAIETDLQVQVKYYQISQRNKVMREPVFENIV